MSFNPNLNKPMAQPTRQEKELLLNELKGQLSMKTGSEVELERTKQATQNLMNMSKPQKVVEQAQSVSADKRYTMNREQMETMINKLVNHAKKSEAKAKQAEVRVQQLENAFDQLAQVLQNQAEAISNLRRTLNINRDSDLDNEF